jgi:hypothetical protein
VIAVLNALRWDVVVQARNGFYWASAFLIAMIGSLLLSLPEAVRANSAALVPAILIINLQITTFFFVAGLILLERDEGTLAALAVSPEPDGAMKTTTGRRASIILVMIVRVESSNPPGVRRITTAATASARSAWVIMSSMYSAAIG